MTDKELLASIASRMDMDMRKVDDLPPIPMAKVQAWRLAITYDGRTVEFPYFAPIGHTPDAESALRVFLIESQAARSRSPHEAVRRLLPDLNDVQLGRAVTGVQNTDIRTRTLLGEDFEPAVEALS